jgi:hypothetical protein
MVVAAEVEDAVDQEQAQFRLEVTPADPRLPSGRLGRDHHIAEQIR